jgi:hypothetical protein
MAFPNKHSLGTERTQKDCNHVPIGSDDQEDFRAMQPNNGAAALIVPIAGVDLSVKSLPSSTRVVRVIPATSRAILITAITLR